MFAIFGLGSQELIVLVVLGFVLVGLPALVVAVAINFVWQQRARSTGNRTRFSSRVQVR